MKATCYLRVAKTPRRYLFAVTAKPSASPISDLRGNAYPTRQIRLNLDLPDDLFNPVAVEVEVPEDHTTLLIAPALETEENG